MSKKISFLVSLGLCLMLAVPSPLEAAQEKGTKKCTDGVDNDLDGLIDGADPDCSGGPTSEDTKGGKHPPLILEFRDSAPDNLQSDDEGPYVDKEGASVQAGGQTQPNAPGIKLDLGQGKKNDRQVFLDIICSEVVSIGVDNCNQLPDLGGGDFELLGNFPVRGQLTAALRPYELDCPDPLPGGECPDIFTMQPGSSEEMSYRLAFSDGLLIEIASAIGGDSSPNPGRCLSLLTAAQRTAFLGAECADPTDCNVTVEAFDNGAFPGDGTGAGAGDGENDEWDIDADNAIALICDRQSNTVIGQTTLTFGFDAIKK